MKNLIVFCMAPAASTVAAWLTVFCVTIPGADVVAQNPPATPAASPAVTNGVLTVQLNGEIALSARDVVSFRIMEDHAEAVRLTVTDTGDLDVPYIGRVKAARKTCKELAQEIKARLEEEYYYHATVVLGVDSLRKQSTGRAYLTGQIRAPGPVDLAEDEKLMVSEAILKAGGFSDFAEKRRVKIMRQTVTPGVVETLYVDVLAVWEKGRKEKDLEVKPGDQIFVASKLINF